MHMGTKIVLFGEMSSGLMKQKWKEWPSLCLKEKGGGLQAEEHHPSMKHGCGSIMLWGCFAAGGTGALHKIDGIMREENCVDILKQDISQEVKAWSQMGLPNGQ